MMKIDIINGVKLSWGGKQFIRDPFFDQFCKKLQETRPEIALLERYDCKEVSLLIGIKVIPTSELYDGFTFKIGYSEQPDCLASVLVELKNLLSSRYPYLYNKIKEDYGCFLTAPY